MKWQENAKRQNREFFQYDELLSKLIEYDYPHRHEFTFVQTILLPKQSISGIQDFQL